QVVVVGGQAGVVQAAGLVVGEHAQGDAGLHAEAADDADHVQDTVELRTVVRAAPRGAHAEARGPQTLGLRGALSDFLEAQEWFFGYAGLVAAALRAIA